MGNHSPGRFRKQGREAFVPGETDPEDWFDYPKKSWWYTSHLENFLEGWKEAEDNYVEEVPCTYCGSPTEMLSTKLCDHCWQLKTSLESADPAVLSEMIIDLDITLTI